MKWTYWRSGIDYKVASLFTITDEINLILSLQSFNDLPPKSIRGKVRDWMLLRNQITVTLPLTYDAPQKR